MNRHLSSEFWLVLNAIWVAPVTANYLQRQWFHKNKRHGESETKATQATWTRKQTKSHNGSYGRRNWDSIWQKAVLGLSSPQALLNTVWVSNMIHFSLRGCKEEKELRRGDIVVKNISSTLNAKQRLERERIHGINGRSSRECMPTTMPFLIQDIQRKTTTIHAITGFKFLFVCKLL